MANINVPLSSNKQGSGTSDAKIIGRHIIIMPSETAAIEKSRVISVGHRRADRNDSRMEAVFSLPKGRPLACPPRLFSSKKRSCTFQSLSNTEQGYTYKKQRVEAKETLVRKFQVPVRSLRQPLCQERQHESFFLISSDENEQSHEGENDEKCSHSDFDAHMAKNIHGEEKSLEHLAWVITLLASLHQKTKQT